MNKAERKTFNPNNKKRYDADGGAIGTFIQKAIRPYVERKQGIEKWSFRFHDTRATFGMNLTDLELDRVDKKEITLGQARENVKAAMGHRSASTTDKYLNFRHQLKYVRTISTEFEDYMKDLCKHGMEGST
jgi:integrase